MMQDFLDEKELFYGIDNPALVTTEEQFEIYGQIINLHLQRHQIEQVRDAFAQFAAQAQKQPPEDPVHETVRGFAARLY
jgi:hypothetical protein